VRLDGMGSTEELMKQWEARDKGEAEEWREVGRS
jgi:hypothetical protein